MEDRKKEGLSALGHETRYKMDYAPEVLETFENMHPGRDYWVKVQLPGVHDPLPDHGAAGLRRDPDQLYSRHQDG